VRVLRDNELGQHNIPSVRDSCGLERDVGAKGALNMLHTLRSREERDAHHEEEHVAFPQSMPEAADSLRDREAGGAFANPLIYIAPQEHPCVNVPVLGHHGNAVARFHLSNDDHSQLCATAVGIQCYSGCSAHLHSTAAMHLCHCVG
jgi:hypothetical protein